MSEKVRNMFADISGDYDKMNDILSFGIHHRWRKYLVKNSGAAEGMSVLDCATGTGDLAIEFKKAVGKSGNVTGSDFTEEMLVFAREKVKNKYDIDFEFADVMNLQYNDNSFDISSISFGIRNVDEPFTGVSELARVVKPGGKVIILEFGQPKGFFSLFYKIYSKILMPALGKLFAGNKSAYTYLPETAAKFPSDKKFKQLMLDTGRFSEVSYKQLSFGIAYIYTGTVK